MNKQLKKLIEARKALLKKVDAILELAETEKRDLTPEQETERKALMADIASTDTKIKNEEEMIESRKSQDDLEKRAGTVAAPRALGDPVKDGPSEKEQRDLSKFSFVRAFNAMVEGRTLDGLEKEMHEEGTKELRDAKVERQGGNLIIPQLILARAGVLGTYERRDTTATGTTSVAGDQGGLTIQTTVGSLIDRLRNKLVMRQMGMTILGGLQGNIAFPKVVADDQAVEKAENAASAESSVTFGQISLAPRRLPVFAEVSRQLLLQTTADIEAWLRDDLAFQVAQVMDRRAINGSGSANQPYGILNTVGISAELGGTNGAAPTWDNIVNLETAVAALNADMGNLGYLTNTKMRGKLKRTAYLGNTVGQPIWDRQNSAFPLNEYKCAITNLMPSNLTKGTGTALSAIIFGNFADAMMGQWGGLEFLINPYSRDTEGLIRINCWTFYDFVVRRVESFAAMVDAITV